MDDRDRRSGAQKARPDLHHAAWIARRDDVGLRRARCSRASAQDDVRRVRLDEVVDPGAAAAHLALVERHELEPRNRAQARRAAEPTRAARAAGGRAHRTRRARGTRRRRAPAPPPRAARSRRAPAPRPPPRARATPVRRRADGRTPSSSRRSRRRSRRCSRRSHRSNAAMFACAQAPRRVGIAGVRVQRAAAPLARRARRSRSRSR